MRIGDAMTAGPASAGRNRTCRCRAKPPRDQVVRACRRPSDSAAWPPGGSGTTMSSMASISCSRFADGEPADGGAREIHAGQCLGALDAQRVGGNPTLNDAEDGLSGLVAERPVARPLRPAQRQAHGARGLGLGRPVSFTHSSNCMWMSLSSRPWISIAPARAESSWRAPVDMRLEVTPFSSSFRSFERATSPGSRRNVEDG